MKADFSLNVLKKDKTNLQGVKSRLKGILTLWMISY